MAVSNFTNHNIVGQTTPPLTFSPKKKYNTVHMLGSHERGKNSTSCVAESRSKRNGRAKKWIKKDVCSNYSILNATSEVFYGQLAAKVYGKYAAPKTKFNPDQQGIVSRVLGDDTSNTESMLQFIQKPIVTVTREAQVDLVKALAFGVIIGDRDIATRNLVVKYNIIRDFGMFDRPIERIYEATKVYGIDHEFSGMNFPGQARLKDFLPKVLRDTRNLIDIILRNTENWSFGEGLSMLPTEFTDSINNAACNQVNVFEVQSIFKDVASKIAQNDFAICEDIKQDMLQQVTGEDSVYSQDEVEQQILPMIDHVISSIKSNVTTVQNHLRFFGNIPRFGVL